MAFCFLKSTIISFNSASKPFIIFRYLRNTKRVGEPRLLKGSIKPSTQPDLEEFEVIQNYQDFVKSVKSSVHVNDVEIEEALNSEADFGTAIGEVAELDHNDISEDKYYKSFAKKRIIQRKYFKLELESTLLTHAAKEQIRYLHRMDPVQWSPEILSQSFPITVSGVKKLLKSSFVMKYPERIRQHDKEVAERWDLLKSGTPSPLISPYTQHMWDEGKIMKEHYNGNPNLPNLPPVVNKTVIHQEEKEIGEYSAIIQQYINYKKRKESPQNKPNTSDELQVSDSTTNSSRHRKYKERSSDMLYRNKFHVDDETDDTNYTNSYGKPQMRKKKLDGGELLHSQFKENLKEEMTSRKSKADPRYVEWMEQQSTEETERVTPKPVDSKELFSKISKFRKETLEFNREGDNVYFYDEKLGYQHPKGRNVQSKINLSNKSQNKKTVYKVGKSVYDKDGEFLYKIPR